MSSLSADFNELMERMKRGREFGHASYEPIYYLVFSPRSILDVKRQMKAWEARLSNDGWDVHTFSITSAIQEIFDAVPKMVKTMWQKQCQTSMTPPFLFTCTDKLINHNLGTIGKITKLSLPDNQCFGIS